MNTTTKVGFIIIILLVVGFALKLISDAEDMRNSQNNEKDIDVVVVDLEEEPK